ncbi:hypothetical protein Sru01_45180 [Sphaerisporangium rufum]|uniref:DUF4287 domain-containing protein n=1 Tax=Sphaerisporangium rufum TaxID=1381558 RepID=A0A919R4H5_9ACTN|nr:hypothetical protein [Sphaerisporangium rufum]GII79536.1 hypothetical protein Sru01_45180 [Sphaerisporangium rufum]
MTSRKSFKSRVRARAAKTGESYTTARRRLLADGGAPPVRPAGAEVRRSKVSEATIRARTSRGWDEWFALLDAWGATGHSHTEIARRLREEHQVDSWSSQNITVAYEQERGMRVPGQNAAGHYGVSAGKTIHVPVEVLYRAFADPEIRARWLPVDVDVRTATAAKTFRAGWPDGSTRVVAGFTAKGESKAVVAVAHEKVTDPADAARLAAFWRERLAALKALLTP